MLGPDGEARFLHDHGPLLGLGLPHPVATVHETAPGTRLVLITDGLVEVRTEHLDHSLAEFSAAAPAGPAELTELRDALLPAFGEDQDDDIALLAVRLA
ncbi:SpoIIE family protein phosphatase [Streptomyces sp. AK02-01A]|uniref:SpoIIE family protein phosphatase n=1 Tax=Streptomyces sp. AK02-01A TaxID=3028648 RepID=UPI0029BDAB0C|nr:SpoIIE family protein phosphatase [Streptomyces sp. AK02-01A]MDX3853938.1 SpoIIE family protein phosphatase [Streptomyces sp. AK02-01A]